MDALEFLKERKRLCTSCEGCDGCPLEGTHCVLSYVTPDEDYKRIIATVERWSKEHPRKTRQSVFLEQWPDAKVFVDGVIDLCPQELNSHYPCQSTDYKMRCQTCRREFWMREVE